MTDIHGQQSPLISPDMNGYIYWVGAKVDSNDGIWKWVDGTTVDPYSYVYVGDVHAGH